MHTESNVTKSNLESKNNIREIPNIAHTLFLTFFLTVFFTLQINWGEIKKMRLDWIEIFLKNLPLFLTVITVLATGFFTYKLNIKNVERQNEHFHKARLAEHENKISEFRHDWLQNVRETGAELCKSIQVCQSLLISTNLTRSYRDNPINTADDIKKHQGKIDAYLIKSVEEIAIFHRNAAKLKLLFKNNDEQTKTLFSLVDGIRETFTDVNKIAHDQGEADQIILELSKILKDEWEITKARSWNDGINQLGKV